MPNLGDDKNARKYLKPCRHPECLKLTENRFCVNHFKPCKKVKQKQKKFKVNIKDEQSESVRLFLYE